MILKDYIKLNIFNNEQLNEIKLGLEEGVDVSLYAKPEFCASQMEIIRYGLIEGIDVRWYLDPTYTDIEMDEILSYLQKEDYRSVCIFSGYSVECTKLILLGIHKDLNVFIYTKLEFNKYQMKQIYLGLLENLDVSVYAKTEFDEDQMEQIFWGLRYNLDISIYAKPEFDWTQMQQIYYGFN